MAGLAAESERCIQHVAAGLAGAGDAFAELVVQLRYQPARVIGEDVIPLTAGGGYDSAGY